MAAYWKIAAHSAYDMFSTYKYLLVNSVFSYLGFWSGDFFLIAPFPDCCLLVPFCNAIILPCRLTFDNRYVFVDQTAMFFNYTPVGQAFPSMIAPT